MIITVKIKNSYGRELIYPGRKGIEAIIFAKIAGKTTLSREHIENIRNLGFTVETQQQESV